MSIVDRQPSFRTFCAHTHKNIKTPLPLEPFGSKLRGAGKNCLPCLIQNYPSYGSVDPLDPYSFSLDIGNYVGFWKL